MEFFFGKQLTEKEQCLAVEEETIYSFIFTFLFPSVAAVHALSSVHCENDECNLNVHA